MDLQECLEEMTDSINQIEEQLINAESNANAAKCYAESAESEAYQAKEHAEYAESNIDDAKSILDTLREEFDELQERIEELTVEEDEDGEKSVHLSDLQKDMAKHKVKVLKLRQKHPSATVKQLAKHLGLGEFLVKRILESEGTKAA